MEGVPALQATGPVSPLSLVLAVAAVALVGLGVYVWNTWIGRQRGGQVTGITSVGWFGMVVFGHAVWALLGAIALETPIEAARLPIEIGLLSVPAFLIVFWLLFALSHTGRGDLVSGRVLVALLVVPGVHLLLLATNAIHGLSLRSTALTTVGGVTAFEFQVGPAFLLGMGYVWLLVILTLGVLFRAVRAERRLYGRQSGALAAAVFAPLVFNGLTAFGRNPLAPVDLTPFGTVFVALLLGYAVFSARLFATGPAVRNLAAAKTIDELDDAVLVLDGENWIVRTNDAAAPLLACDPDDAVGRPLGDVFAPGTDAIPSGDDGEVEIDHDGTIYDLQISPIGGTGGAHPGRTLLFRDISALRRRQQGVDVLNRFLRHNLRNELTVITTGLETVDAAADGPTAEALESARTSARTLLSTAETAREVERAVDDTGRFEQDVTAMLADIVERAGNTYPKATVRSDIAQVPAVAATATLERALWELVANACEHGGDAPAVDVTLRRRDGTCEVVIRDDGPGLPDHERAVLDAGEETDLKHGSGVGLWLAHWVVTTSGGELSFDVDDGTAVTVGLPVADGDA